MNEIVALMPLWVEILTGALWAYFMLFRRGRQ